VVISVKAGTNIKGNNMRKENILVVVIICIAIAGFIAFNALKSGEQAGLIQEDRKEDSAIDWQAYTKGMELAVTKDQPIFLYFHAEWCTYCQKLKKTTFKDEAVLQYLQAHFVSISVDTDKEKTLTDQWKVKGLPTLWFLRSDNSKISNIPGYVDEKQFLRILKYVHTKSYDKMSFHEFVKTI